MKPFVLRTRWGALGFDPTDKHGSAEITARMLFGTRLYAMHRDGHGHPINDKIAEFVPGKGYDLGSGLVTNVGVLALANDYNLAAPSGAAINLFHLMNYHITGTGATAAAATDIKIQTISTNGGQTAATGTQSLVSAANSQKYQTVGTLTYTGSEAVTEWCLITSSTVSSTTGTPFTAGTATTGTVTATPLTASSSTVQGQQQTIFENTGNATPHWGLVTSNTTSVVTVPAWYKVSDGTAAGTTPANGNAYTIRPILWDRKVFSAINVVNTDTIAFTYQLTVTSGG